MRSKRPARSTKNQPTDVSTAKKLVEPADISDPVNRDFQMNNIQSVIDENVNQKSVVSQINQDKETIDSNSKEVSWSQKLPIYLLTYFYI
jgi:hypothetical protein